MSLNDADLDICFATDDFGVEAVFDVSGNDVTVNGHFTEATESISIVDGEIEANDASFACKTSDVEDVKNGMTVEIDGSTFEVKRKHRLGTGVSLIYLKT